MQPSSYLVQAALLMLLHRKDVLGAFGPADLITWTSNITLVTRGAMDCVFVEELMGIDAAKNGEILSNPFNSLSSQPISMTNSLPTSSRCHTLSSSLPPPLRSPSFIVKTVVVVIIVIVAAACCLCPIQPRTAPRVTPPPPSRCLTMGRMMRSSVTSTVPDSSSYMSHLASRLAPILYMVVVLRVNNAALRSGMPPPRRSHVIIVVPIQLMTSAYVIIVSSSCCPHPRSRPRDNRCCIDSRDNNLTCRAIDLALLHSCCADNTPGCNMKCLLNINIMRISNVA
jgi:hypothetical protein